MTTGQTTGQTTKSGIDGVHHRVVGLQGGGEALVDHMTALIRASGLPSRLSQLGVARQDLPVLWRKPRRPRSPCWRGAR